VVDGLYNVVHNLPTFPIFVLILSLYLHDAPFLLLFMHLLVEDSTNNGLFVWTFRNKLGETDENRAAPRLASTWAVS
jgi:hypothetical protein